jgi:hypothetical protein
MSKFGFTKDKVLNIIKLIVGVVKHHVTINELRPVDQNVLLFCNEWSCH